MRVLIAQINPIIGDIKGNTDKIVNGIKAGRKANADLVLFPELCISGYPPEDFLLLSHFLDAVEQSLHLIIQECKQIAVVVGLPRRNLDLKEKSFFNSAAIIECQTLLGFQDKILLPTYDVFDERRYFEPASSIRLWKISGKKVAVTICEDIWQHSDQLKFADYRRDPIEELRAYHPDLLLNLSSSPFSMGKIQQRLKVGCKAALTCECPILYCNQVGGNDSLIFDGYSFYADAGGQLLSYAKGFEEDLLLVDLDEDIKPISFQKDPLEELYRALVLGLRDYFQKSGFKKACLGLSGGIDSALVACLAVEALGAEHVLGIAMPSRFSSEGSFKDAKQLADTLGISYKVIPIEEPFQSYLDILTPHFENKSLDVAEENLQARIRGMILMALSNKLGYIVLSTGNKSELAMGYSTLYGDMCGGLAVISDLTKVQVYALSNWINRQEEIIPWNSIRKPPSAELRPNQKDSDTLPPYDIIDNVLQDYVEEHKTPAEIIRKHGYKPEIVFDLIQRIHRNEYKRRQSPPGLRISEKAFSIGRRFPIVQRFV
jgi:NAD+ synthase (glutamine-hydrolysing)